MTSFLYLFNCTLNRRPIKQTYNHPTTIKHHHLLHQSKIQSNIKLRHHLGLRYHLNKLPCLILLQQIIIHHPFLPFFNKIIFVLHHSIKRPHKCLVQNAIINVFTCTPLPPLTAYLSLYRQIIRLCFSLVEFHTFLPNIGPQVPHITLPAKGLSVVLYSIF